MQLRPIPPIIRSVSSYIRRYLKLFNLHRSSLLKSVISIPLVCIRSFVKSQVPFLASAQQHIPLFSIVHLLTVFLCSHNMSSTHYNRVNVLDLLNHDNYPFTAHSVQRQTELVSHSNHYVCNLGECTRRFSSEKALTAHFEKAHGSSTQYICPHCRSSFSTSPNLNKHVSDAHAIIILFFDSFSSVWLYMYLTSQFRFVPCMKS